MENPSEILPVLRSCSIFDELSDRQLERIVPHLYEVYYHAGSFIIQQGELGTELFIIKQGSVDVLKKISHSGKFHQLTTIPSGEVFGELAIIDNGYRSASIRAAQPTTLLVLTANALHTLDTEIVAGIYKGLAVKLSQRLRFINDVTMKSVEREHKEKRNYNVIASCIMLAFVCAIIYSYSLGSTSCLLKPIGPNMSMQQQPVEQEQQTQQQPPNPQPAQMPLTGSSMPSIENQFQ